MSSYGFSESRSSAHDITPDEDRNCNSTQVAETGNFVNHEHPHNDMEVQTDRPHGGFLHNGWYTEILDQTPDRLNNTAGAAVNRVTTDEVFFHENNRLKTFQGTWQDSYFVQPADLARNGFIYIGPGDKVQCMFCLRTLWNWEPGDSVEGEHRKHYPKCSFVRGQCEHLNVPLDKLETSMGLHMKTDEQVSLMPANCSDRVKTYKSWPKCAFLRPESLAEAGFFYLGKEDQVRCFSCGTVVSHWQPTDCPWSEHARLSPDCSYVKSVKGTEFIRRAQPVFSKRSAQNSATSDPALDKKNGLHHDHPRNPQVTHGSQQAVSSSQKERPHPQTHVDDLQNSAVKAVMQMYDLPVEKMRQLVENIKISKGPDHKVTVSDFEDLIQ